MLENPSYTKTVDEVTGSKTRRANTSAVNVVAQESSGLLYTLTPAQPSPSFTGCWSRAVSFSPANWQQRGRVHAGKLELLQAVYGDNMACLFVVLPMALRIPVRRKGPVCADRALHRGQDHASTEPAFFLWVLVLFRQA